MGHQVHRISKQRVKWTKEESLPEVTEFRPNEPLQNLIVTMFHVTGNYIEFLTDCTIWLLPHFMMISIPLSLIECLSQTGKSIHSRAKRVLTICRRGDYLPLTTYNTEKLVGKEIKHRFHFEAFEHVTTQTFSTFGLYTLVSVKVYNEYVLKEVDFAELLKLIRD